MQKYSGGYGISYINVISLAKVMDSFHSRFNLAHSYQKSPIYTKTSWIQRFFFCSTSSLKALNRLKSLKLPWLTLRINLNEHPTQRVLFFLNLALKSRLWTHHRITTLIICICRAIFNIVKSTCNYKKN
jgi:hypothetical protein